MFAKSDRYPFVKLTCPVNFSSFSFSVTIVKPFDSLFTYGKSTCSISPNKIIILGDMLELGEHSKKEHEDLSVFLNPEKIDIVFTYGPKMLNLHKKLSNNFKYSRYFSSISDLKKEFKNIVKKNDLVFLKGSRKMKLEEVYN